MCLICIQFEKDWDIVDARAMLNAARREPGAVPEEHLEEVEMYVQAVADNVEHK